MVNIRGCTTDDLAGLLDLYRELRPHDPPLSGEGARTALEALLADPRVRLIVAEVDGELAATCQLGMVPTLTNGARPFGIIEHVITAARFRRRGLSQRVLEQALTGSTRSSASRPGSSGGLSSNRRMWKNKAHRPGKAC